MIDNKMYKEIQDSFSAYLESKKEKDKGRRKTEVRFAILSEICGFPKHFDMDMLQNKLNDNKFHVSKATLYNTLNVLIDAGLVVRHQFDAGLVVHRPHQSPIPAQYELRKKAETHQHFICTQCHRVREIKKPHPVENNFNTSKNRLAPEYVSVCVYGLCGRCRSKTQREIQKDINQSHSNNSKK
jgi:Fur family ferric uptake transcriptional regulator